MVNESPYGVRDMAGNVWEWCAEILRPDQNWRVLRGGSFHNGAMNCRVPHRVASDPSNPNYVYGVRLCVELAPNPPCR